jgi:hypothetical protein
MKKTIAFAFAMLAAGSVPAFAQSVLSTWNFDTATISGSAANFGPIAADIGSGSASGHHASAAATWSSPVGNGSAKSFSVNTWAVGDYFQFQTSTAGFSGIDLSWDQTGSGTGPKDFGLFYSTDGTNFTQFWANYSVALNGTPNTAWTGSGTRNSFYTFNYDLSSVAAINNVGSVTFRLVDSATAAIGGGSSASGGTDRVDNFSITAIPEPSTYALFAGLAGLTVAALRRRRLAIMA